MKTSVVAIVALVGLVAVSAFGQNKVVSDNQSGDAALVKTIGPTQAANTQWATFVMNPECLPLALHKQFKTSLEGIAAFGMLTQGPPDGFIFFNDYPKNDLNPKDEFDLPDIQLPRLKVLLGPYEDKGVYGEHDECDSYRWGDLVIYIDRQTGKTAAFGLRIRLLASLPKGCDIFHEATRRLQAKEGQSPNKQPEGIRR